MYGDCDHTCDIGRYELDAAVDRAKSDAETQIDSLRYELERRIELLTSEVHRLRDRDNFGRDYYP